MKKEVIVLSLGGSVFFPDEIDVKFLLNFKKLIRSYIKKYKFVIITGGGKICRKYVSAARRFPGVKETDLDVLGVRVTRLNAKFIRLLFKDIAGKNILKDPSKKISFEKIIFGAGWEPGHSSDWDAVIAAKTYNAKTIVNMTNVNVLYDKDPAIYKTAKPIKKTTWSSMLKITGTKWRAAMNYPFDPTASKLAKKYKLTLILIGKNLNNFKKFLDKKQFKGSVVQ